MCIKISHFCFRMYWVDVITKLMFCGLLLWTFVSWSESIFDGIHGMLNLVRYIVSSGGSHKTQNYP
jgi:hypothetical protein